MISKNEEIMSKVKFPTFNRLGMEAWRENIN